MNNIKRSSFLLSLLNRLQIGRKHSAIHCETRSMRENVFDAFHVHCVMCVFKHSVYTLENDNILFTWTNKVTNVYCAVCTPTYISIEQTLFMKINNNFSFPPSVCLCVSVWLCEYYFHLVNIFQDIIYFSKQYTKFNVGIENFSLLFIFYVTTQLVNSCTHTHTEKFRM